MPQLEARRSERIDYRADVELLARSGAPHSVTARALDLGSGGMRLATRDAMPIGAEVTCRMTLDGRPAAFHGRVVWSREHGSEDANAHGMGVCFEALGAYETGLLRHVVERSSAGFRPVELHFAGIDQPVVARARAHADGLRLSAALPIFARGTELSFQLDEEGPHFTGRIGNARLLEENGARRIEIDVNVASDVAHDGDPVRFRRRARYGYAEEIEAKEQQELQAARIASAPAPAVTPSTSASASPAPTRRRRISSAAAQLPVLPMFVAALVGGTLAWSAASRLSEPQPVAQAEFVARPLAVVEPKLPSQPPEQVESAALMTTAETAAPETATPETPTAETAAPETPTPETPTPETPTPETAVAEAPSAESSAGDAEPTSHVPRLPQSVIDGAITRIRIPFAGSLRDMHSTVWAEPEALSIELPDATTSLEPGRYPIADGGVTDLRVNRNRRSLLLRIRLSAPIARYTISAENGVLEAQLHRARVSRAAH